MFLCMVSTGCEAAREFYISPDGNDSNPGTCSKPWQTVARVNAADLEPSDRVLFEGGKKFAGPLVLTDKHSGSPEKKVELTSYGEGRAILDGGNISALTAKRCSHLAIRNLNFVGAGRKTGNTERGVSLAEGDDIVVDQVEVSGFRSSGLVFAGVHNGRATHIYAHDNGADGIAVGAAGEGPEDRWSERIYLGYCIAENNPGDPSNLDNHSGNGIVVGGVRDCLIEYCEAMNNGWDMPRGGNGPVGIWAWKADRVVMQFCVSHDNKSPGWDGGGFDLDGGVTNSIMQYNYSYNNQGPGYFLCQYPTGPVWKNNIVRYNISVNDGGKNNVGCGIEVYGGDERISDAEVYNNTVYNTKGGAVGFGGLAAPRIRFHNNIFVTKGELIRGDASPARFEGNIYWQLDREAPFATAAKEEAGGTPQSENHKTYAEWAAATGQEMVDGKLIGIFADPLLTEAGTIPEIKPTDLPKLFAYRLQPGSPGLKAGLAIADNGGRDFWGTKIPGDKPTIGAYQEP